MAEERYVYIPVKIKPRIRVRLPVKTIYIKAFRTTTCPHCHEVFDDPNSAFNQALEEIQKDKSINVVFNMIEYDHTNPSPEVILEFEEANVKYVPTVFVNGNKIPNKLLYDKQKLLDIFYGRMAVPPEEKFVTKVTHVLTRWRR